MMKATPQSAYGPKRLIRYSGSIQDGSSIGTSTWRPREAVTSGNGTVADCEFPSTSSSLEPRRRGAIDERAPRLTEEQMAEASGHLVWTASEAVA